MVLLIVDKLSCKEGLFFRHLTMLCKIDLNMDIVVESPKKDIDSYFKMLKAKGWGDFVDEFVEPEWRIEGIRVDRELSYPLTVKTKSIDCSNCLTLAGQIKNLHQINSKL
jgi:hypothetical protein